MCNSRLEVVAMPDRPAKKLVGIYMPYEEWEKLVLLAYVRQLENRDSATGAWASSKSRIMIEAFEEFLRNHPDLVKKIEIARQTFHIEEGEKA